MACKITKSLKNDLCEYAVAGASLAYVANWYPPVLGAAAVPNAIAYEVGENGQITGITLPTGEQFYELDGADNTISFTDALLEGANGAKYRQHTLNMVLNQFDADILTEADALSLGRFIAVVVDSAGRVIILGRTGGLSAPAGGMDYNSGAAAADAMGWTVILQGTSGETGKLLTGIDVVEPIYVSPVVEP